MTYSTETLPADERAMLAAEAHLAYFDAYVPDWREAETDPEERTTVAYFDVLDPASPAAHRTSPTTVRLNPGVDGDFEPFSTHHR